MKELSIVEKYNIIAKRIEKILKTDEFRFDVNFLKELHKYLFIGLLDNAGEFRTCNLVRKEAILYGDSVVYSNFFNIELYLNYDMNNESVQNYINLEREEFIKKICLLNTKLWLTHPFKDGNTRTISVFMRLFFNRLGYEFDNELFRNYFSFYRDALVLASYSTPYLSPNDIGLELFFNKMLFDQSINLDEYDLHVDKFQYKRKIKNY